MTVVEEYVKAAVRSRELVRKLRAEIRVLHLRLRDANRGAERNAELAFTSYGFKVAAMKREAEAAKNLAEFVAERDKLDQRFPCGHRIVDWDNSYGDCAACLRMEVADRHEMFLEFAASKPCTRGVPGGCEEADCAPCRARGAN